MTKSISFPSLRAATASLTFLGLLLLGLGGSHAWAQFKLPRSSANVLTAPVTNASVPTTNTIREVDYIVALVDSEPITRNDVLSRQRRLEAQWAAQGVRPPPSQEVFKHVLDQLIEDRVQLQTAKEDGISVSDAQVNDALENIARQNKLTTIESLKARYESEGGNWVSYRDEIRDELTKIQVREREVDGRVRVSETDIDQALQEKKMTNQKTQNINLAQILIALPENPSPEAVVQAKQKADQVIAQAHAGEDFAKLAETFSDAGDKSKGGELGLRSTERYPPLFMDAVRDLKAGDISAPVRSDAGFHVLKVLDRQDANTATVTQSKARHILLPITPTQTEAQATARLKTFKTQIETGTANFATLAKEYSTDGSAAQGGDLGWSEPGMYVPEFEKVMNALPIGTVSEPFTSRFGVHMLEVTERRQAPVSLLDQRNRVRDQLREKKISEAYVLWIAELRARAFVEYKNMSSQ